MDATSAAEPTAVEPDDDESGMRILAAPCAESFAGRPVLATCRTSTPDVSMELNFYQFSAIETDVEMLGCIDNGGTWAAMPQGSPEWRAARRASAMGDLQRATQDLEQLRRRTRGR